MKALCVAFAAVLWSAAAFAQSASVPAGSAPSMPTPPIGQLTPPPTGPGISMPTNPTKPINAEIARQMQNGTSNQNRSNWDSHSSTEEHSSSIRSESNSKHSSVGVSIGGRDDGWRDSRHDHDRSGPSAEEVAGSYKLSDERGQTCDVDLRTTTFSKGYWITAGLTCPGQMGPLSYWAFQGDTIIFVASGSGDIKARFRGGQRSGRWQGRAQDGTRLYLTR